MQLQPYQSSNHNKLNLDKDDDKSIAQQAGVKVNIKIPCKHKPNNNTNSLQKPPKPSELLQILNFRNGAIKKKWKVKPLRNKSVNNKINSSSNLTTLTVLPPASQSCKISEEDDCMVVADTLTTDEKHLVNETLGNSCRSKHANNIKVAEPSSRVYVSYCSTKRVITQSKSSPVHQCFSFVQLFLLLLLSLTNISWFNISLLINKMFRSRRKENCFSAGAMSYHAMFSCFNSINDTTHSSSKGESYKRRVIFLQLTDDLNQCTGATTMRLLDTSRYHGLIIFLWWRDAFS